MAGDDRIAKLTSDLVAAYLAKMTSPLSPDELIKLVNDVRSGLEGKDATSKPAETAPAETASAETEQERAGENNASDSYTDLAGNVATRKRRRPLRDPIKDGPAIPISKSVTPGHIICLEDGRHMKMLKSHLRIYYNLTPEEYRQRWNLPVDYPMTAPLHSEMRKRVNQEQLEKKRHAGKR